MPVDVQEIPEVVNRWLGFQDRCGRSVLFSERYISQPIAEYLLYHHSGTLQPECNHPTLLNSGQGGRPRQIDFALLSRDTNAIITAVESKWIPTRQYNRQQIVDDLLRLECVRITGRHVRRYFIVGGRREDFKTNFRDLKINAGGKRLQFTKSLISFRSEGIEKKIDVANCGIRMRQFYKNFEEDYSAQVPKTFKTILRAQTKVDGIYVFLWEVGSARNRRTFSPKAQG